ncbi:hypothetical protein Hdeb2414_s0013g00411971 [Helianthus debilis subsp. tardiflorus]
MTHIVALELESLIVERRSIVFVDVNNEKGKERWYSLVETLKLQSGSWLVFQYEEALEGFRIFYFYDNIAFAPSDYFYYRPNGAFDKPDAMHINRLFVHHKMDNTIPNYLVLSRGPRKHKLFV